jgi:hypothetical protein
MTCKVKQVANSGISLINHGKRYSIVSVRPADVMVMFNYKSNKKVKSTLVKRIEK